MLAVDNLPSPADGNATLLVVNRVGGDLSAKADELGPISGLLFNDAEKAYSFSFSGGCQFRSLLTNSFPRTAPRFSEVIAGGQSGWMKLWAVADRGILGAIINARANAATSPATFSGGRNLHKLMLTNSASYLIPVFPPGC